MAILSFWTFFSDKGLYKGDARGNTKRSANDIRFYMASYTVPLEWENVLSPIEIQL